MSTATVKNWFGGITSSPHTVVHVTSVEQIIDIVKDTERYPAPVRADWSNHSTTPCGTADDGTMIVTRKMDKILEYGEDRHRPGGRAVHRREPGAGQARSAVLRQRRARQPDHRQCLLRRHQGRVHARRVRPDRVVRRGHQDGAAQRSAVRGRRERPGPPPARRSSYGLFGIVYEATFRTRKLAAMEVHHEKFSFDEFARQLPDLRLPRRVDDALHQPVQGLHHCGVPALQRDELDRRPR